MIGPLGPTPRPTRTPLPPGTPYPTENSTPLPEATVTPPEVTLQAGWESIATGLQTRTAWMWVSGVNGPTEIHILRIDPTYFELRVHADLNNPATVSGWEDRTGAVALINGAFFEPGKTILGLLIQDGQVQGRPFDRHGGMLTVEQGAVRVRSILKSPLEPDESPDQAISGRPMLLYSGGLPADFNLSPEASRRTVVAQDRSGRVLFIVNDSGTVSLYQMRDWLATSPEFNIDTAFNLDGGGSTGMAINMPGRSALIDSWWAVASVLAVYPRQ